MNENENAKIGKIEIDENAEPTLVEVDIKDVQNPPDDPVSTSENPDDKNEIKDPKKSSGKQLSMQNLFIADEKTIDKRQKLFKRVFSILFVVIIVGTIIFTALRDFASDKPLAPAGEIFDTLSKNWFYLPCALLALFFAYFFKGLKLSVCAKHLTGKWHFKTCMGTAIVGHYYNYVTPLAVGGQPFEIYYLSKHGVHGGAAASLPIATFFQSQFAFTIIGVTALILLQTNALGIDWQYFSKDSITVASTLAIAGLILGFLMPLTVVTFCFFPRVGAFFVKIAIWFGSKLRIVKNPKLTTQKTMRTVINNATCLKKISTNPLVFISSFLMGMCEQLALLSIAYFTLRFFGFDMVGVGGFMEWMQMIEVCVILQAAVSFFPTPGNSGAADLSFYFLFETGLKRGGFTFPAMITWRLLSYYSILIIGFIFLTVKKATEKKHGLPLQ
ncbi:MAG: lysylphosphatidylglycerol synthase transmembrane domain-containing protein [Clostridia bacterium]|nr:lysylphosphatidylglycerol synthase transmembrane domain-containing protein [Clostridia bacterium]